MSKHKSKIWLVLIFLASAFVARNAAAVLPTATPFATAVVPTMTSAPTSVPTPTTFAPLPTPTEMTTSAPVPEFGGYEALIFLTLPLAIGWIKRGGKS